MAGQRPFEEVVVENGPTVLRVCRALLARLDAEDAWSETFLAALRAYPQLPPNANVQAWLVTIAHRKSIDALRAQARRARPIADLAEAEPFVDPSASPDSDLWDALRALPAKQRQCLAYHHLVGLGYAEIAVIVGGTPEAARRAAADGLKALRRSYPALVRAAERDLR